MKRTYLDGRRIRSTNEIPLNEWHHLMVVDLPWWRVAWGWAKWAAWGRWQP